MADNYLEKQMDRLREVRPKVVRNHPSLDSLLKRNRTHRGFDAGVRLTEAMLRDLVAVVPFVASGMNAQRLRFRLVPTEGAALVHPHITLGAALPEEHLPHPGEEPAGYIVVCCTGEMDKVVAVDLGMAAQSMLLKAAEMGLNGVFILNFRADALRQALDLPLTPIAVIGLGKGLDRVFLLPAHEGDSLRYYRKDGVHFVPKLQPEDLII